ncbi:helix-turn-helix domain-containing protein [Streptomyces coeruleorubidus]|uniref:helix-turn-helix domain-containing protein n=1 Tax=Streptomyces coeruleorubidus TaxID=116188 RepID=UPI0033A44D03
MIDQPHFGRRLRTLRQERGLSQAKLAGDNMSPGYLSRLESGARPPTPKVLAYLAEQLNVPVSAFEGPARTEGAPTEDLVKAVTAPDSGDGNVSALLERVAHDQADLSLPLRWLALWSLAGLQAESTWREAQLAVAQELLKTADESGVPELRVRSRVLLSRLHRSIGDMKAANAFASEAYADAIQHELPKADVVRSLMVLISTEAEVSRLPDALKHVTDLEKLSQDASGALRVEALWTASSVYVRHGNHAAAATCLAEALELSSSGDDLKLWMRLRFAAASLYLQMHPSRLAEAQQVITEVEPALDLIGTSRQHLEFRTIRAHALFQAGELDAARALCAEIGSEAEDLEFRDKVRFEVLANLIKIVSGQVEAGVRAIEELAREAHEASNMDLAAEIWKSLAETLASVQSSKSA